MDKEGSIFDFDGFIARTGRKRKGVASELGLKESTVGNWCTGTSTPNYATIVKLVQLGMTAQELFGKELGNLLVENSCNVAQIPPKFDTPEFRRGLERVIADMKANGIL